MKPITTTFHGFLDYTVGTMLIAGTYLFEIDSNGPGALVLYVSGFFTVLYSLLTNYAFGVVKLIPMKLHLFLDLVSGIFLASSPWLFGFSETVFLPHVIIGIIEVIIVMLTSTNTKKDATNLI